MSRVLSREDGLLLVSLAKDAIASVFSKDIVEISTDMQEKFSHKRGVVVTIHKRGKLRGCIGYPKSDLPLYKVVMNAAKTAAFQDPRFVPISKEELLQVELEVSVLTEPKRVEEVDSRAIIKKFKAGKDGVIIQNEGFSGIMLPHVATAYGWSSEEFLGYACTKAGLHDSAWREPESRLYKFNAQIFHEN